MDTKKQVLFVIDSLNSGGAEKSLVTVLNLLDKEKYNIDLMTFSPGGLYNDLVPSYVNRIESKGYLSNNNRSNNTLFNKIYILFLRTLSSLAIRVVVFLQKISPKFKFHTAQINWIITKTGFDSIDKNYDTAIAYSQGLPTYYVASKVKANKKISWLNINYDSARYSPKFDSKYYKKFANIVNVSKKSKEIFLKQLPNLRSKAILIYDILSAEVIKKMSWEDGGFIDDFKGSRILTIGRLAPQKGYDIAVEACKILKIKGLNFRWYVIGEGAQKEYLRKLIKKNNIQEEFQLIGTFPNPYPFVRQCDIYCQTSKFEGFGLAIAEARILAKGIVTTNFNIIYDQLVDGENGLISEMNALSVANNIERLLNDSRLKNHLIANLKKKEISNESEILKIETILDS